MNVITATNLTKTFGNFTAVDAISFAVKRGEVFGFLGANGAGKTTAIKMLIGLSKPSGGSTTVAGFDLTTQSEKIKERIGYMSQKFSLYEDLSVRQNINFYGGVYGLSRKTIRSQTARILDEVELQANANDKVGSLPLGWKQRLSFAVASVHDPDIVFLDEPTGGVDPATRRQFWEMIYAAAAGGRTIFVTTHYMDEAEYCDRISIMVAGKIAALGTPGELKQQYQANSMGEVFLRLVR
ncbi:ABC transporter ATP-binding protein [Neolewinella lacunae]|uniref:ABC transporter ATP-binding protein n=1 Tax=Neolewinella lacunae TaxID=1517758 RepID=A0A923T804_9BACT|nr:ABC transporter ATP-binding protein [Neolewinella lacunae]MBC6995095.1 ABC transporter ATP-binding protein [Neolewinella lacunae]MDN3634045.1 ABC transporter ATP-binding protein [Neolewinella lacunae]